MDQDTKDNLTGRGDELLPPAPPAAQPSDLAPLAAGPDVAGEPPPAGDATRGRITRRAVLGYGLAGAAGLAGAGALASLILGRSGPSWASAPSAEVFPGDAPTGETWELWRKRTWAREARHWRTLGSKVRCRLCPNNCLLADGDRGRCRNRVNKAGTLYTLVYGNPCSLNNDPIEKKPLYHFLPGTLVFSLATSGCGFRCMNCQNWDISQRKPEETKDAAGEPVIGTWERLRQGLSLQDMRRLTMMPEHVVAVAEALKSPSIAYTYSEPTCFFEYMYDTSKLARQKGVRNVVVTCGYIHAKPLEELCEVIDGAHVDLKGFSEDTYRTLNSGKLQPILDTLKTLKERGVWFEVVNLVVPTYTDKIDVIRRMCDWLAANIGPDYPLHFSAFHPQHKLTHLPPTPTEVLLEARAAARQAGLRYVYLGNVMVEGGGTTLCPSCGKAVIDRHGYIVRSYDIAPGGKCRFCQTRIPGVWVV